MRKLVVGLAAGVVACVPGCAPAQSGSAPAVPVSRASATADLLVAAEVMASGSGSASRKALVKTVDALERIGARAQTGEEDVVAGWREQAGPAAANTVYRGRVLGPAYRRGWLEPGGELKVEQLFLGGQAANVAVAATPSQPMQLTIQGSAAAPCGAKTRDCRWTPIFTERYTIRVRNGGSVRARYYLVFD